jgi:hypothetical protein
MSKKLRSPFVGHPDAILFWRISQEGVFQQPQAITLKTGSGILSAIAMFRHPSTG